MRIDTYRPGQSSALAAYAEREASQQVALSAVEALDPHTSVASGTTPAFRQILARHDVRSISPRDFSELAQSLFEAGEISAQELQEFAQIRLEADLAGAHPDEAIDFVSLFEKKYAEQQEKLAELEKQAGPAGISSAERESYLATTRRQLEWLEKLAAIHEAGPSESIDALV
ncbi:MAG: hypothetical protein KF708_01350 [Pirellulales bacterium]|nr:hypothetical protein [Pirellulales bacterium]